MTAIINNKYQVKPLTEALVPALSHLYKEVFNTVHPVDKVRRKYFSNHQEIHAKNFLMMYDGQPVAYHGSIICYGQDQHHRELGIQTCDFMTHKDHRGQGLFTKLALQNYEANREMGVRFAWGFPNQNSEHPMLKKLDYLPTKRMNGYSIPVKGLPVEAISRKIGWQKSAQKRIAKILGPLITKELVANSASDDQHGGILRDAAFYASRDYTPNYRIRIDDSLFWVKTEGGFLVGDLTVQSERQVLKAIENLKQLARKLGLNKSIFQSYPGTLLDQILQKQYPLFP
ncbi:MAG: GNAT family N-acetyltransferase, partial [Bacteroidota bacterium]